METPRRHPYSGFLLAAASGLLLFFSAPGPFGVSPVSFLALIPLFIALRDASDRRGFLYGLCCGMCYYPLMIYWIVIVLGRYGFLPWWISFPAMLLLALYMSVYLAFFSYGLCRARKFAPLIWAAPVLWVGLDQARSFLLSGFPWQDLGYSLYNIPILIQIADIFGHHGVTFLIVMINVLLLTVVTQLKNNRLQFKCLHLTRATLLACLLIAAAGIYNFTRYQHIDKLSKNSKKTTISVLQGNIPQGRKWNKDFRDKTIEIYTKLTKQVLENHENGIVVWPETALPFYPREAPTLDDKIRTMLAGSKACLLTGAPHRSQPFSDAVTKYYNSAFLFSPDGGIVARYDKQHLVPFGEYVPLRKILFFLGPLVETIGDFSPGLLTRPLTCRNAKLGVLICFESIFPELARRQVSKHANLLVNITNDAWFGRSSAPVQHLSMAVYRAVENRRSLARAANTGISGFINPKGELQKLSALFEPAALSAKVELLDCKTVFTHYGGHHFASLCLLAAVVTVISSRRRNKSSKADH